MISLLLAASVALAQFHAVRDLMVMDIESASSPQQPYGNLVRLEFSVPVLGRTFSFDLGVMHDLFAPNASVELHRADGSILVIPHVPSTYGDSQGRVVATLHTRTQASVTFLSEELDQAFHVIPRSQLLEYESLSARHKEEIAILNDSELVFYFVTQVESDDVDASKHASLRGLMQRFPSLQERWVGCHGGKANENFGIKVGVLVDRGYYAAMAKNPMPAIQQMFATINMAYKPQLGIVLQIGETIVKAGPDSTPWNMAPTAPGKRCAVADDAKFLEVLEKWRRENRMNAPEGIFHQFTNCFPSGIYGLAYPGSVCSQYYSTSWTSHRPGKHWYCLAHEIGHNLGALHTFQLGQGKTGGFMDYGSKENIAKGGVWRFNRKFSESEICNGLKKARGLTGDRYIKPGCMFAVN